VNVELIVFVAAEPGMADRLLRQHADDGTGHCRVCSSGAGAGRSIWPCQIYECASRAKSKGVSRAERGDVRDVPRPME
jgi:hypothetical protein